MKKRRSLLYMVTVPIMILVFSSASIDAPVMVERNLFSKSRKPASQESATVGQNSRTPSLPKWIQLDGIMAHNKTKKALVRLKGHPFRKANGRHASSFLVVREGEAIGDYKVSRINIRSIWLEKAGIQYEVSLFGKNCRILPSASPAQGPVAAEQGRQHAYPSGAHGDRAIGSLPSSPPTGGQT